MREQDGKERLSKARDIVAEIFLAAERRQDATEEKARSHSSSATISPDEAALLRSAREKAVRFMGLDRGKSSGSVRAMLMRHGFSARLAGETVSALISDGYIDDRRAAKKILARQNGKSLKSRSLCECKLIEAGVDSSVARKVVEESATDRERLGSILGCTGVPREREERLRLCRKLQSRGFHYAMILEILNEWGEDEAD